MTQVIRIFCFVFGFCTAIGAAANADQTVRIFAAASLRGGLEAALESWPGQASVSYGGSGAMARQVALGAPADLVLLANPVWDVWLAERIEGVAHDPAILGNRLVLIGNTGAQPFAEQPDPSALAARLAGRRLAIGQRSAVPAGQYAREWLEHIGAWEKLQSRLAEAENVRAAMAFVARGEAPMGIVYASDAAAEPRVSVLWAISPGAHSDIRYPARALTDIGNRLLQHLETSTAQSAFTAHGFLPSPKAHQ